MADNFTKFPTNLESPFTFGWTVTPSSTVDLTTSTRGILVGGAGNLIVTLVDMADGAFVSIPSGNLQYHPIRVKRVWATSTASNIVGFY